jgi:hypothetical protein
VIKSSAFNHLVSSTTPTAPLITKVEATDADEAVIFFNPPASDGGSPVYYYTAISNPGLVTVLSPQSGAGSITVTGLTKATTYTFTLTAHNINGSSRAGTSPAPITTLAEKIVRTSPTSSSSSNAPTLAAPAFTLSSSSQSVIVNNAITTVTNTSTGGAIASYAISPAAPSGLTFSTTTGQLSGTPTSTQSATNYTITATNATGSATATFTLTVSAAAVKVSITRTSLGTSPGAVFTTQPQVTIQDSSGNTITSSSAVVTATISTGGTLIGTKTATASSGVATFTNLGIRGFGGTAYTITYTASGLTADTQSVTPSALTLGATGPGGGKIFYVAATSSGFDCGPSLPLSEKCYYLESALDGWNNSEPDPTLPWAQISYRGTAVTNGVDTATATAIGSGYQNTLAIIRQGNSDSTTSAAALAQSFRSGGQTDWFLPSKDELTQLYLQRAVTGFSATGYYQSSSEVSAANGWMVLLSGDASQVNNKGSARNVRPIRAF